MMLEPLFESTIGGKQVAKQENIAHALAAAPQQIGDEAGALGTHMLSTRTFAQKGRQTI